MRIVSSHEEEVLLSELKTGSEAAFGYFYERYSLQLYRKLLGMVRVDVIAQELLQDLFVRIWEKRALIDPERSFKAYLYTIAERLVYDHFRKLTREARLERALALGRSELADTTEETVLAREAQSLIDEAIRALPEQQRRVFTLCKIDGKSYEEASALLGISTGTINTHITRATKTIKAHLLASEHIVLVLALSVALHDFSPISLAHL